MSNEIYEEKFRLRISDFDCYDRLTPCAILDLSQDVAGKHADILHVGYDDFIKNDCVWMLLRTRFEIFSNPKLYSTVNVKTWPREKGRCDFDRDTLITDENDNVVCKIQSKWVIVNVKTRRLILPRNYDYPIDNFCKDKTFDLAFEKIEDFDVNGLIGKTIFTQYSDLDHNGHVNNVSYVRYALNLFALEEGYYISNFEINYIHELKANETLELFLKQINNEYYVKGIANNNTIFICKITTKRNNTL